MRVCVCVCRKTCWSKKQFANFFLPRRQSHFCYNTPCRYYYYHYRFCITHVRKSCCVDGRRDDFPICVREFSSHPGGARAPLGSETRKTVFASHRIGDADSRRFPLVFLSLSVSSPTHTICLTSRSVQWGKTSASSHCAASRTVSVVCS